MKSITTTIASLLALRAAYASPVNQTALAERETYHFWYLYFYADGCPAGDPSDSDYLNFETSDRTEYCDPVPDQSQPIHNVYVTGITGQYTVTLFSDEVCSNYNVIATFSEDGCYVVPANTGIETIDVVASS